MNPTGLEYLADSINAIVFGTELFPGIHEKAARYAVGVIQDHIFFDGNKRTGLLWALTFLDMNGWTPNSDLSDDDIVEFGFALAQSKIGQTDAADWFAKNTHQ